MKAALVCLMLVLPSLGVVADKAIEKRKSKPPVKIKHPEKIKHRKDICYDRKKNSIEAVQTYAQVKTFDEQHICA